MQLAERIFVKENQAMADLCLKQTVVYNQALWYLRQEYFFLGDDWKTIIDKNGKEKQIAAGFLTYYDLNDKAMLRWKKCYRDAIPGCAANTIARAVSSWKAYWAALKVFRKSSSGFTGKPKMPGYTMKGDKSPVYFSYAEFTIVDHHVIFPKATGFEPVHVPRLNEQKRSDSKVPVKQVRVIPVQAGGYWVECVHDVEIPLEKSEKCKKLGCWKCMNFYTCFPDVPSNRRAGIDLNLNRVVMIVFSDSVIDNKPIGFSGGPVKSINQWWNKEIARLQADLYRHDPRVAALQQKRDLHEKDEKNPELTPDEWKEWKQLTRRTKQMNKLTTDRNNRVHAFFHRLSREVVNMAIERGIGVIVIGHNKLQKQEINLGDRTNQNFVQIPVFKFIGMLAYKCELAGIEVVELPEDYTTQSSFYDNDPLPTLEEMKKNPVQFSGSRLNSNHRYKLYKSNGGKIMNGDVNDAYNILRKAFPNAVNSNGIEGARLHPMIRVIPAS